VVAGAFYTRSRAHSHEANDDIFYILEGTIRFLVGDERVDAAKGTFVRVPAGVITILKTQQRSARDFSIFIFRAGLKKTCLRSSTGTRSTGAESYCVGDVLVKNYRNRPGI
jgi:uncharacterized RmlC-like cupin family protein